MRAVEQLLVAVDFFVVFTCVRRRSRCDAIDATKTLKSSPMCALHVIRLMRASASSDFLPRACGGITCHGVCSTASSSRAIDATIFAQLRLLDGVEPPRHRRDGSPITKVSQSYLGISDTAARLLQPLLRLVVVLLVHFGDRQPI